MFSTKKEVETVSTFLNRNNITVSISLVGKQLLHAHSQVKRMVHEAIISRTMPDGSRRGLVTMFYSTIANSVDGVEPTAEAVIYDLQKEPMKGYASYCYEKKRSQDTSLAEKLYLETKEEWGKVQWVFEGILDELRQFKIGGIK